MQYQGYLKAQNHFPIRIWRITNNYFLINFKTLDIIILIIFLSFIYNFLLYYFLIKVVKSIILNLNFV